jgi:hypothetical protein
VRQWRRNPFRAPNQQAKATRPIASDERTDYSAKRHCFVVAQRFARTDCATALDGKPAHALAKLLPLLGCGEEAAVVGFDRLSRAGELGCGEQQALHAIANDERHHDALLRGLQSALPRYVADSGVQNRARRFHLDLSRGGSTFHLARVAGLDAAVCTILSRLLRPGSAIARDAGVHGVLNKIRSDETRHVLISREIALASCDRRAMRSAAAEARAGLSELLACGVEAFEALGVDPDRLVRDVGTLPNGLLPR